MLLIYKSSAGSGKTYTLVKEFIRIALKKPEQFKHILALTFTNKAANEMKSRIIKALEEIISGDEKAKSLIADLCEETELEETALVGKAQKILRNILHNYSDLSVSTIDSFVHRVLRAFTYDLHLSSNFEVELDSDKLLTETIEILMDRLSDEDDQVTNAVVEYAESNIEEGKSWNLEHSLVKLAKELFNEDAYPYLEKLGSFNLQEAKSVRSSLYKFSSSFEKQVFDEAKAAMNLMLANGLTEQSFFQGAKGVFGYFAKYANQQFPNDATGNSYVIKTIYENKWGGGKAGSSELLAIEGIKTELEKYYQNICDLFKTQGQDYSLSRLLLKNFYSFVLLADIQRLMDEYKKTNNLIHVSEFQQKIHAIVREQEAPVIYERIGDWYDNILIDEHQDTSVLQWQNLLPLVENSQFKSADSLVVGDGKQAIYRFRNGKVEQFAMLPDILGSDKDWRLKEREVAISNYGTETRHLQFNFRSRNAVIDFNNSLYNTLSEFAELKNKAIYIDHSQKPGKLIEDGYVSIEFLPDDDAQNRDEQCCLRVETIIAETQSRGYSLRDIAVLTRSNRNASTIASYLIERGVAVVSSESVLINNSPKVKLIIATLGYLDQKGNHIARAEMTYYIHQLLLNKELRFETFDFKTTDVQFEHEISTFVGKKFSSYELLGHQLTNLLQELIDCFSLDDNDPFLQFLQDEALTFSTRNRGKIREFLEWWEEVKGKKSIIYPETLDAVKIMTIHKSKGLEFPVVIMADADWPQQNTKRNFWVEIDKAWLKQLPIAILPANKEVLKTEFAHLFEEEEAASFLDMLNLVYVATTRAEDMLYILSTGVRREPERNNSVTALWINFLKQIGKWDGFKQYHFGNQQTLKILKDNVAEERKVYEVGLRTPTGNCRPLIKRNSMLLWNADKVEKINKGNLLHEMMKRIRYANDVDKVLQKMFNEGLITEMEMEAFRKDIGDLLSHKLLAPYFNQPYKILNERAIMNDGVMKVPDRIAVNGDVAVILDYKTGAKRKTDIAQLNDYAVALSGFGFRQIKKILVYIETKEVEVLPDELIELKLF